MTNLFEEYVPIVYKLEDNNKKKILDTSNEKYEAGLLKLNCDKALSQLKWHTALNFKDTVRMTSEWYRSYYQDQLSILKFTEVQISQYHLTAKSMRLEWAL